MAIERRPLGRTGLTIPSCCLGTMTWGEQNTEAEGHAQMDYALERGIDFFDTAELYAIPPRPETQGRTEEIIGTWFKARGTRDKVFLATKIVGRSGATWHRNNEAALCRLTKHQVDFAVEHSLRRLQTDHIDLYQMHWPDRPAPIFGARMKPEDYETPYEPFEDILDHLGRHVEAGRIRYIGVSNETPYGVMRFLAESEHRGLPRIQSIQNVYNLVSRKFEEGLDEVCMREDVSLLAYSPLGQGYLTGKYRNGALPEGSRKQRFDRLQRYEGQHAAEAIEGYLALAEEVGIDPAKMAIRFCDTRPFMTSTIIGATSLEQLSVCVDAFEMDWDPELERRIHALHRAQPSPCP